MDPYPGIMSTAHEERYPSSMALGRSGHLRATPVDGGGGDGWDGVAAEK